MRGKSQAQAFAIFPPLPPFFSLLTTFKVPKETGMMSGINQQSPNF